MKKHFETKAIRTQMDRSAFAEHSSPLYLTSSFVFDDAEELRAAFADEIDRNIYSAKPRVFNVWGHTGCFISRSD